MKTLLRIILVLTYCLLATYAWGQYYVSPTGSDGAAGTSAAPWLTPNHALTCGATITAVAGTYSSSNFGSGQWGAVSGCTNHQVAILQCATFDACKITSGGMIVTASNWMVTGWEVNAGTSSACFAATPPSSTSLHDIIFANNVANGCGAGGITAYNNGTASIDYFSAVGNIVYNAAQNATHCFSGISIYQPVASDSVAGTHIYVAGNFPYGNVDPSVCNGTAPTDGDGIIFDTFDGTAVGGPGTPYTQQAVAENNISVANGGRGLEAQNYSTDAANIYFVNNTLWGNLGTIGPSLCSDMTANEVYGLTMTGNLDVTTKALCTGTSNQLAASEAYNSTGTATGNIFYPFTGGVATKVSGGTFTYSGTITTNPVLSAPTAPTAPSCTGATNARTCANTIISNFTATATGASAYGYQSVSSLNGSDPLFPVGLCNGQLPTGLVTQSCPLPPKCLFTNIPDGPATGGEGGNGTYLYIYGHNFGSSQGTGTVTINGTPVAQYLVWGSNNSQTGNQDMIGVQVASGTSGSGNVVVTTQGGSCGATSTAGGSFALPFTVTTGHHIYFIGSAVDNTTTSCTGGTYTAPWGLANTTPYSRNPYNYYNNCLSNGDTLVFLNGVNYPYTDNRGWSASMTIDKSGGTATNFVSLMSRPGATAIIGGQQGYGIRGTGAGGYTHYTGLTAIGKSDDGMGVNNNDVIIGNIIECPTCGGEAGALDGSSGGGQGQLVLGNWITQVAVPGPSNKQYHDLYMSGNNWEVGWNKISGGSAYNGIQVNEDSTTGWHSFSIHDNEIEGANGSCITFVTVNPNAGYVEGFNNVLHDCGVQQASDGSSDTPHNGMSSKASATSTAAGSIEWWNNTLFNTSVELNTSASCGNECGLYQIASGQTGLNVDLRNNANMLPAYAHAGTVNCYFADDNSPGPFTGTANLFYSVTACASTTGVSTVGSLTNPGFTNPTEGPWQNFIPASGSPMIGAGAVLPANVHVLGQVIPLSWDFAGNTVNPAAPQIGALAPSSAVVPSYTLTQTITGTGTISGTDCASGTYTSGTTIGACTATAGAGYVFTGWSGTLGCTGTGTCTKTLTANSTLIATFTPLTTYTLACTYAGAGTGTLSGTTCNANYSPGTAYSFTATANSGSVFGSWSSTCGGTASGNVYSGTMPAANCTVTPTFNLVSTYTLTQTTSGAGTGTVTGTCGGTYSPGAAYSCNATAGTGSSFSAWTSTPSCGGTASGTNYAGNMPAANCSVNAAFTLNSYALTTATAGSGSGTVTGCAGTLFYGMAYTCTATPAGGSVFASWSSTCGGTATGSTYHGSMPAAACSVTATFNTTPTYTLSTSTAGTGSGTVTGCAGSLIAGASYSCSASPSTGSTFTSWSSTCGGTASGTTYAGSMPAASCNVQATFTLNTFTLSCSTAGTGSGTISGSTCNTTYGYGASYSFTATASGGSSFVSWASSPSCGGSASGAVYSGTMPNAACTVTPTFNLTTPGKGVTGGQGVIGGKGTVGP